MDKKKVGLPPRYSATLVSSRAVLMGARWMTASAFFATSAQAHFDPVEAIAKLTLRIEAGDRHPLMFHMRGVERIHLKQYREALDDFSTALGIDASFLPALREMTRVHVLKGDLGVAAEVAERMIVIGSKKNPRDHAQTWVEMAKVHLVAARFPEAVDAVRRAIEIHPKGEIDWYIVQAEAERGMGKGTDAADTLKRGFDAQRSIVLRNAWLDALLDLARGSEVAPVVEAELASHPLNPSWLIRRARMKMGAGETGSAREDLHLAIREVSSRLSPEEPDPALLIERGAAWALLGDKTQAAKDLAAAADHGPLPDLLKPLVRIIQKVTAPTGDS